MDAIGASGIPAAAYVELFGVALPLFVYAFLSGGWVGAGGARPARQVARRRPRLRKIPPPRNAGARMTTNITGRMKIAIGKSIFTGAFCARSSACICRRCRRSRRLGAQDAGERRAELVRGEHGVRERDRVLGADAVGEAPQGRPPATRRPGARSGSGSSSSASGPSLRFDEVAERGVEAHPGLDRDRELIDEVRQLGVDAVRAPRRRLLEEEAGQVDGRRTRRRAASTIFRAAVGEREPGEDAQEREQRRVRP